MTFPFHRFSGVDTLFNDCKDRSILDVGCGDGLVSLEFVRNGANIVHGVDNKPENILFCKKLYRHIGIESYFYQMDLCMQYSLPALSNHPFKQIYDIVLFMSVYENLSHRMGDGYLYNTVLPTLKAKCGKYLVVRSNCTQASYYKPNGFTKIYDEYSQLGNTLIYEKNEHTNVSRSNTE